MANKQQHIIYSNSVELEFYGQKENLFIQNRIADLVKHKLLPAMETLFDQQTASGKKIKIDSLEIDLGDINNTNWEYSFVDEAIYKLRNKLNEIISFSTAAEVYEVSYKDDQPVVSNIRSTDEIIKNFGSFLQSGILPWNALQVNTGDLLNTLLEAAKKNEVSFAQKEKLLYSLFYTDETLKRFILQFEEKALLDFFRHVLNIEDSARLFKQYKKAITQDEIINQYKPKLIASLLVLLHSYTEKKIESPQHANVITSVLNREFSAIQPQILDKVLMGKDGLNMFLQQHIFKSRSELPRNADEAQNDILNKPKENNKDHRQQKKPAVQQWETGETFFVNNAGIVILSPFLKQMFVNLGLSSSKEFISEEAQARAVLLSQYLITGKTEIPEHELLLNKILCGFPLDKTLPSQLELTGEEMIQGNELLQSVLEYWKELKTTNAESLQNTFLMRNGKLVDKGDSWHLQVEYKSYDIMMQFLPWSIGIIYLPWMQKRLMVEWHA